MAVADVFDALVSERPYKHAWTVDEGFDYLKAQKGKHFDPTMRGGVYECGGADQGDSGTACGWVSLEYLVAILDIRSNMTFAFLRPWLQSELPLQSQRAPVLGKPVPDLRDWTTREGLAALKRSVTARNSAG